MVFTFGYPGSSYDERYRSSDSMGDYNSYDDNRRKGGFRNGRLSGSNSVRRSKSSEKYRELQKNKQKPAPITYDEDSYEKSPISLKVTLKKTTPSVYEDLQQLEPSSFSRLATISKPAPITYDEPSLYSPPAAFHEALNFLSSQPIQIRSNMSKEMENPIFQMESRQRQILRHVEGLRDTIDQSYREITRCEAFIYEMSQEIEILKRRFVK